MKFTQLLAAFAAVPGLLLVAPAFGATISTQFDTGDGFITGDFGDVTLTEEDFSVTFSGGQQQQMFNGPSYNVGPAAYLFINGGPGFTGASGNTAASTGDTGLIDFSVGVAEVSFFAANQGNGPATTLNIFGTDDTTILDTVLVTQTSNQSSSGAVETIITSDAVGGPIGSIGIDLPGPAANPPYVLAIDTFSATAVPFGIPDWAAVAAVGAFAGLRGLRKLTR